MAQWNTTFNFFHRGHNAHMPCETEKFTYVWPRRPHQSFVLPPNIRIHKHPQCPNSCRIFCQTPSVLTFRNCTIYHTVFMMLYALHCIALLITPATIISQCLLWIFISGLDFCTCISKNFQSSPWKSVQWNPYCSMRSDTTKLTATFRNCEKGPKISLTKHM